MSFFKYFLTALVSFVVLTGCSDDDASLSLIPNKDIKIDKGDGISSFAVEIDESSIVDVSSINANAYVITGSCDSVSGFVTVTVSSPLQTEIVGCIDGSFTVTFDLTALTSTTVSIVAEQAGESDAPSSAPVNDQTSAAVTIDSAPDISYDNQLAYSPSGACSEEGEQVTVVVGGVPASPQPNCVGGTWSLFGLDVADLSDGLIQIVVDHSDSLGNPAPQVMVTVDKNVDVPSIITAPTAPDDPNWPLKLRPGDLPNLTSANAAAYRFAGYCSSGQGDVNIIFGSLSFIVPCNDFFGFYEHTVDVSSETGANPIQHCATQSVSPMICASPVSNELAPPGMTFDFNPLAKITITNETAYNVRGSCAPEGASISIDMGVHAGLLTGSCGLDNRFNIAGDVSSLSDGLGLSVLGHITASGNTTDVSAVVTKGVLVDLNAPQNILASNYLSYSLSGSCSDDGEDVVLNIGGFAPSPQPTCAGGSWSIIGMDLSSVSDSPTLQITVDHSDENGNAAVQHTVSILKDTVLPAVVIASAPNIVIGNETSYALSGLCSESGEDVVLDIGGFVPNPQPVCVGTSWSMSNLDVSAVAAGTVVVSASQTDAAGNSLSVSVSISNDTSAPTVAITSAGNITSANESSYSLNGDCSEDGRDVILDIGGFTPSPQPVCSGGAWSATGLNISSVANGFVAITADHSDASGNNALQASQTVTKFNPVSLNITDSSCANPYVSVADYTFAGGPAHSYNGGTDTFSVSGVNNWQTLVAQEALPEDFEISFRISSDTRQMIGFSLSSAPATTWTGIESLLLFYNNAYTYRYANGTYQGNFLDSSFGGFPADVRIEKSGTTANYYINENLVYTDSTIPSGVSMYLTFAGLTGYTTNYEKLRVKDLSLPDEGYFIAGDFSDPNGANGPYELYDSTNDVVIGEVTSPFNIEYNSGLNTNANIVVRSVGNIAIASASEVIALSDCLEPLLLNLIGAGCFGPIESVTDYSFSGNPTYSYDSGADAFSVTGSASWNTLAAQELLPSDFEMTFTLNSDTRQFVGFSATSTPSNTWTGIESSILFYDNTATYFYANGSYHGNVADSSFGGFPANVRIEKIGNTANFYINENLVRTDNAIASGGMYITFGGSTSAYTGTYANFRIEDLSPAAVTDYKISGTFEDPNGGGASYELYDVTNDVVIAPVTSPFEVVYNSGSNANVDIVVRRVSSPHVASPNLNIQLDDCL